jgi:hypothetical protein
VTGLTDLQRGTIAPARELAALGTIADVRTVAGTDDTLTALAWFWGVAGVRLAHLADTAERLAGGEDQAAEDSRCLRGIRDLLSHFDWEYHDRQLALEAIERIVEGEGNAS